MYKQDEISPGPSQEQLTARGIIKAYTTMQASGVAVGPLDLAGGTKLLLSTRKQGFPWLSANLLDHTGKPLFAPSRTVSVGRIKVTLIGLTGAVSAPLPGITVAQWQDVLPALIKTQRGHQDILVLLSTLSPVDNEAIAGQFPEIHLIVTGNNDGGNRNPQQINNSLLTQTDRQGKYLGLLSINWSKSGRWGKDNSEELTNLRNRLAALDWQLQRMRQQEGAQRPEYQAKIRVVEENRTAIAEQLSALQQQASEPAKNESPPATFSHQFIALNRTMPESPEVRDTVTTIKRQIYELHQHQTGNNASSSTTDRLPEK